MQVGLIYHEANGSSASQVLAMGPSVDAFAALAAGQALTIMHLLNLKSWPWGPTLESLDSLDSDQGPDLMRLMHLKSWPWG